MNDIQVGDIIKTLTDDGIELQAQILYIPASPGVPWVVKDVITGNKWRIHTHGSFTRTFVHNR